MNFYYDSYGLIVQENMDGGDTAGREGDYWTAYYLYKKLKLNWPVALNDSFDDVLNKLQVAPGVFIRNPKQNPVVSPAKSWNDPTDFSRDQSEPLIVAMGLGKKEPLKYMLKAQIKRFMFFQNYDFAGPQDYGSYIRAFHAWYAYPLLLATDFGLLVNSAIRVIKGRNLNDTSDDINHTIMLLQAQYVLPTPVSWLARKLYKRIPGTIQGRWNGYFNPDSGANPFNELFRPLIERM